MSDDETAGVIPQFILDVIERAFPGGRLPKLYVQWMSLINYAIVCGIGVLINMLVIHWLIVFLPLAVANLGAIITAFVWNWTFTVGPLGYIWGFTPQRGTPGGRKKE